MIHFNDSDPSVYDTAYPIIKHGIPGVPNVISRNIGSDGELSVNNLQDLSDTDWTIAGHPQYNRSIPERGKLKSAR